jgi:hypothetical protein
MRPAPAALALACSLLVTGCVSSSTLAPQPLALPAPLGLAFGAAKLLSLDHAGGEPAIITTPKGTLLYAAHPGYTHTHGLPPSADLLTSTTYESYMWRSDDDGQTWLFADDAVQTLIDRQWITAYKDSVWIKGNTDLRGVQVERSDDGGLTWTEVGQAHVGGKLSSDPRDGTLYAGNGARIDVSTDGGRTWTLSNVTGHKNGGRELGQVAVDRAGTAYTAWVEGHDVWLAATKDKGASWLQPVRLTSLWNGTTNGTFLWPWVVAGSAGRVAVVWYAADEGVDSAEQVQGPWWVEAAEVLGADTASPQWELARATGTVHTGPVCLGGTGCELDQQGAASDRRLGDLFEASITSRGQLAIAYSDTVAVPTDSIAHPGFVLQAGGPNLLG